MKERMKCDVELMDDDCIAYIIIGVKKDGGATVAGMGMSNLIVGGIEIAKHRILKEIEQREQPRQFEDE